MEHMINDRFDFHAGHLRKTSHSIDPAEPFTAAAASQLQCEGHELLGEDVIRRRGGMTGSTKPPDHKSMSAAA